MTDVNDSPDAHGWINYFKTFLFPWDFMNVTGLAHYSFSKQIARVDKILNELLFIEPNFSSDILSIFSGMRYERKVEYWSDAHKYYGGYVNQ